MSCRTCNYYDVGPDADGRVRMRKNRVSPCRAPIADVSSLLPHSVTKAYGWSAPKVGGYMSPDDGDGCPLHTVRARPRPRPSGEEVGHG